MALVGIDAISFYTPNYYLDLRTLAKVRGVSSEKFCQDLGQSKMAVTPPGEDSVTLAANAANNILQYCDINDIAMLLFATESGVDCSKAGGMYLHRLLNLPSFCRVVELKQACYAATAGLQLALAFLRQDPNKKILLIASDIARYQLGSVAESSQGAGAVAMLLSASPRILAIDPECGVYAKDIMDFWRPLYCDTAIVDGKLSCDAYLKLLEESWRSYQTVSGRDFKSHQYFCYHTPVPKMVELAHRRLAKQNGYRVLSNEEMQFQVGRSLLYSREIGNIYTASLYLGIISLLENAVEDLSGQRLGLYSYGSGSVGEYFSGTVISTYRQMLQLSIHQNMLQQRQELTYDEYEFFCNFQLPQDGTHFVLPACNTGKFKLVEVKSHQRYYAAQ